MVYGHLDGKHFIPDSELLYQLSVTTCPHYTEAGCAIYSKRPGVCRAWPVAVDLASLMLSGKAETKMKVGICPSATETLPTASMRTAVKRFAQNWTELSSTILANKRSVYIIDVHHRVRYKLTNWLNVPLKD